MTLLIKDLRLQLAQLNSFLIENYLLKINKDFNYAEHQKYFFNVFHSLSEGIAALGIAFGKNDKLSPDLIIPLKKVLTDAAEVTYLVEKSSGIEELAETVSSLKSANLQSTLANIVLYSKQFSNLKDRTDDEVAGLINDNPGYFNVNGSLKYPVFSISTTDAVNGIIEYSSIPQVKIAFRNLPALFEYFDLILSDNSKEAATDDKPLIHLSNTLTIVLIAFGYVEPFFEKNDNIAEGFNKLIKATSATQSSITNTLYS